MPNYKKILGHGAALGATGLGGYAYGGSRGMEIGKKKGLQQGYQMGRRDAMLRQRAPSPQPQINVQPQQSPEPQMAREEPEPTELPDDQQGESGPNTQEKNAMNRFLNAAGKDSSSNQSEGTNRFLKAAAGGRPPTVGESFMYGPVFATAEDPRSKSMARNYGDYGSRAGRTVAGTLGGTLAGGAAGAGAAHAAGIDQPMPSALATSIGALGGGLYGGYKGTQAGEDAVDEKYDEEGNVKPDEVMIGKKNKSDGRREQSSESDPDDGEEKEAGEKCPHCGGEIEDGKCPECGEKVEKEAMLPPLIQSMLHGPRPDVQMPSAPHGNRARMIMMRVPQRGVESEMAEKPQGREEDLPHEMQEEQSPENAEGGGSEEEAPEGSEEDEESDGEMPEQLQGDSEEKSEESEGDGSEGKSEEDSEEEDSEEDDSDDDDSEEDEAKQDEEKEAGLMFGRFVPAGTEKTADEDSGEDPCWDGYEQAGMKTKNGKKVPNCIPKEGHIDRKLAGTYAMAFDEAGERSVPRYMMTNPKQSTEEKIASALNKNLISEDDAVELWALKEAMEKEAEGLDKEAIGMPSKESLMAAGLVAPPAIMAANKAIDPIRERIRYERMKRLPGKPIELGDQRGGGLENARDEWNVPEEASRQEATEKARRRAFGILHDQAPEVTRSPSVARGMIRKKLKGSTPQRLMQDAQDLGGSAARARKDRQQVRQNAGRSAADAAQALRQQNMDQQKRRQTEQQMERTKQEMNDQ
jgi:hypothetical protein